MPAGCPILIWLKLATLLLPSLALGAEGHFVNSSLVPVPGAVRHYTLNNTNLKLLYKAGDCACFCKLSQEWTLCVGKECIVIPRKVKVFHRRLRVTGTEVASIGPDDFADYTDLIELELSGNDIANITDGTFANLSQLVNLTLSANKLAHIPEGAFRGLVSLRSLQLSNNDFQKLSAVVPSLVSLPALEFLALSENTLGSVSATDFTPLANSALRVLELSNCDLRYIESAAFLPLKNLTKLVLTENTMPQDNLEHLIYVMRDSRLKELDLSHLRFPGSPPRTLLEALAPTEVEVLSLRMNTLPRLSPKNFPTMPRIVELDLSDCGIISIENGTFNQLPRLKRLNLASNDLGEVPPAVLVLRSLQWLNLAGNAGGSDYRGGELELEDGQFSAMTSLEYLDLSYNRIGHLTKNTFYGLSRLSELNLQNSSLYRLAQGCFLPLASLRKMNLNDNVFGKQNITRTLLEGLVSLEELYMDRCKISFRDHDAIFSGAPNLKIVSLKENRIQSLGSKNPFAEASSLVKVDLSKNTIRGWNSPLFNYSSHLDALVLAENQISSVTPAMMQDIVNLSEVNLFDNPLDCDCQLAPLRPYVLEHEDTEQSDLLILAEHCMSPHKWRFVQLTTYLLSLKDDDCVNDSPGQIAPSRRFSKENQSFMIALYVLIPLVILGGIATYVIYRSRWLIRYHMFRKRLSQSNLMSSLPSSASVNGFKYDAFVSYSNVDHAFVARLVTMLENWPPHFKLCVYERDFTAGNVLNDCIMESIATSRKVVLVISENFVQSHWCLWELHLAQHSLLEDKRSGLILVVVGTLLIGCIFCMLPKFDR